MVLLFLNCQSSPNAIDLAGILFIITFSLRLRQFSGPSASYPAKKTKNVERCQFLIQHRDMMDDWWKTVKQAQE
jgi:hypothetical protein